jgi:uncharacterized membrane protein
MQMLVPFHVLAGSTALISGAVAMSSAKGGPLHRKAGLVFAIAMMAMSSSGSFMASRIHEWLSVGMGALTFYLVATALLSVRRTVAESRGWHVGLLAMARAIAAYGVACALTAPSLGGRLGGMPAGGYLFFATIAAACAALDARLLHAGGIAGKHRLARHLWRMGFAMFVATGSFFLGQADELPEAIRIVPLLALPVLATVVFTPYWLFRVLRRRKAPLLRSNVETAGLNRSSPSA